MKIVKKDNKVYKITESFYDTIKNDVEEITSFKQFLKETEYEQTGAMNNQLVNTTGNVQNGDMIDQVLDKIEFNSQNLQNIVDSKNQLSMKDYEDIIDSFKFVLAFIDDYYSKYGFDKANYSFYNNGKEILDKMDILGNFLQNPIVFVYKYGLDFKKAIVPIIQGWLGITISDVEKAKKMNTKQMFMQAGNEAIKIVARDVNSIMSMLYILLYDYEENSQTNGIYIEKLVERFNELHNKFMQVHGLDVDGAFKIIQNREVSNDENNQSTTQKNDNIDNSTELEKPTEKEQEILKKIKRKKLRKNEFWNPIEAAYGLKNDILVKTIEALDNVGLVEGVHYIIGFTNSSSSKDSRGIINKMQQRVPFLFKPMAALTRKIVSDEDLVSLMADYNNNLDRLPVLTNEYDLNINTLIKETFKSSFVIYGMSDKITNDINTAILADEGLSKFRYEVTYPFNDKVNGDKVKGDEFKYGAKTNKQYITFNFNRKYIRRPFGVPTYFFNVSATVPMPKSDEDGMPVRITIPVAIIGITTFYGIFRKWLPTSALKKLGNTIKSILTIKK